MPYNPTNWKDRAVERPRTYNLQQNPDGTVTLIPVPGTVYEPGTPVSAGNMNKIEQGIAAAVPLDGSAAMTGELRTPRVWADLGIDNTRTQQINPGDIAQAVTIDFKSGSTIGRSGTYYVVWTFRGWNDDSGGPAYQIAYGGDGIWVRTGTGAAGWGAWRSLRDADSVLGYVPVNKAGDTMSGGLHSQGNITASGYLAGEGITNRSGYFTVESYDDATYGQGYARLHYRPNIRSLMWDARDGAGNPANLADLTLSGNTVWHTGALRWNSNRLEYNNGGTWTPVGGIKNVQRGVSQINIGSSNTNNYADISISAVTLSKSQLNLLTDFSVDSNTSGVTYKVFSARLLNANTIRISWLPGNLQSTQNVDVSWEVIESY